MSEVKELKRFIYSAMVTNSSGSQSFYIDAKSREEADERAANKESDGMYANDSEVTDLDSFEYEDETTVDDFGDFPLISREQSLLAKLEAVEKEISDWRSIAEASAQDDADWRKLADSKNEVISHLASGIIQLKERAEAAEARLLVPVELPDDGLEDCISMWPDNWRNDFDTGYNFGVWRCEQNIKAAGYPVEGG